MYSCTIFLIIDYQIIVFLTILESTMVNLTKLSIYCVLNTNSLFHVLFQSKQFDLSESKQITS